MRNQKRAAEAISTVILLIILCAYWVAILCINFSENPDFYCTDMYSDMLYAVEVWNQKTIFPDGWVFGNQLYAVATPVLAALCYGFVQNPCIAMGVASVLMGLGVIGSFSWMLRPVFANFRERLVATVCFMTVILASGDPVSSVTGWQLFFTMCSYYACYAITAFLAFGCYLRSSENWSFALWATFLAACVFSFGTGIQSLRQTAVMVLPLVALEVLRILYSKVVKKEYFYKSSLIAGTLSVCNLAGVLCTKFIAVEQNEIFGSVFLQIPPYLLGEILSCIKTPFSLFHFQNVAVILFLGLCISCLIAVFCRRDWVEDAALLCILLCVISVAVIFAIDVFTTMSIREIYYFLLYPLTAICTAWVYSRLKENRKTLVIIIVAVFSLTCGQKLLPYVPPVRKVNQFGKSATIWMSMKSQRCILTGIWENRLPLYRIFVFRLDSGILGGILSIL